MKTFNIPEFYKSYIISRIKEGRKNQDPRKKDFSPTLLDFGPVRFYIARHFGFCYGVENAIEISYKALKENPVSTDAAAKVYQYLRIKKKNIVDTDAESLKISFRVTKAWLTENGLASGDISLYRYKNEIGRASCRERV